MNNKFRCDCPITSALDVIGDRWTLVIIKQMLIEGKKTFKDFTESTESIATNILSSRLKMLEEFNIIDKKKLPHNKKTNLYLLTDKGLGLVPIIIELVLWSDSYIREFNPTIIDDKRILLMRQDKLAFKDWLISNYKEQTEALVL